MKLIPLLCIVFIKASEGCNHQNDEKLSKFHTLIRGNEISIRSTGSSQERWHIIRDSICKAKLTCNNFYIPPSEDCLKSSLEVIDGDLIKLRFCGYSSILGEYFLFRGHPYITSANRNPFQQTFNNQGVNRKSKEIQIIVCRRAIFVHSRGVGVEIWYNLVHVDVE